MRVGPTTGVALRAECFPFEEEMGFSAYVRHRSPQPPEHEAEASARRSWPWLGKRGGGHAGVGGSNDAAPSAGIGISQSIGTLLTVNHEALPDEGEDARPLARVDPSGSLALGVFDGMGGAGGARYEIDGIERKGAYLASRLARHVVATEVDGTLALSVSDLASAEAFGQQFAATLSLRLRDEFNSFAAILPGEPSNLRSSMVRVLPTTAAIALVWPTQEAVRIPGAPSHLGCAVWAGDSRIYELSPTQGLTQVSCDDARVKTDALSSLESDPPMDNCISASQEFHLNVFAWEIREPSVVFAASDGCFGYLPTPAHFEITLLDALSGAATAEDWQRGLATRIASVTRDDATLAAAALGFANLTAVRAAFEVRHAYVAGEFIEPFARSQELVSAADRDLARLKNHRDELAVARTECARQLWQRYQPGYERLVRASTRR
jgi:serine/threonine protein phosphatase PrpC